MTTDQPQPGGYIVCYTRCWDCMADQHHKPPEPHPWADEDDREHARSTGQPEPAGNCACWCARPETTVPPPTDAA